MDSQAWDERYAGGERVWSAAPNAVVVALTQDLPPGRALDLAAGEGRNALWLAGRGWAVTAVDFSATGLGRGRAHPGATTVEWVVADVTSWEPATPYDLVVVCYLHLPRATMRDVLRRAGTWLAPGGHLVAVGHAVRNLEAGHGGPQDPDVLHDLDLYREAAAGLAVERLDEVTREVEGAPRAAIDVALRARR